MTVETPAPIEAKSELTYTIGDTVAYWNDPEDLWIVSKITHGIKWDWVTVSKTRDPNAQQQQHPAAAFSLVEKLVKNKAPIKNAALAARKPLGKLVRAVTDPNAPAKKPTKPMDDVAKLLAEAVTIEDCWSLAMIARMNEADLIAKIGHLSNGLKRMGIGNRLRFLQKNGNFDPTQWYFDDGKWLQREGEE